MSIPVRRQLERVLSKLEDQIHKDIAKQNKHLEAAKAVEGEIATAQAAIKNLREQLRILGGPVSQKVIDSAPE